MRTSMIACAALAAGLFASPAVAQDYPSRPIHVIVPFPPGGVLDGITRNVTERLRTVLGQPAILENKGGAGGTIGLEACQKAAPDGYTFCAVTVEQVTSRAWLEPDQWERYKNLFPVTQLVQSKGVVYARADLPANTLDELAKLAASQPGKLNYASFGWGSAPHLFFEWLNAEKKIDIYHVPMKSAGDIMNETIAGRMDLSYVTTGFARPHIESGKIKAIAVLGAKRSPLLPNTPSLGELGLDFPYEGGWFALMGPPNMDKAALAKFHAAVRVVLQSDDYRQKFLVPQAYEAIGNTPEEFARALARDLEKAQALVKTANAKPRREEGR